MRVGASGGKVAPALLARSEQTAGGGGGGSGSGGGPRGSGSGGGPGGSGSGGGLGGVGSDGGGSGGGGGRLPSLNDWTHFDSLPDPLGSGRREAAAARGAEEDFDELLAQLAKQGAERTSVAQELDLLLLSPPPPPAAGAPSELPLPCLFAPAANPFASMPLSVLALGAARNCKAQGGAAAAGGGGGLSDEELDLFNFLEESPPVRDDKPPRKTPVSAHPALGFLDDF